MIKRDLDRMAAFCDFPKERWRHLRTTNPAESPFSLLWIRTNAAGRYKRVDRAMAAISKMMMVGESKFRREQAPELMPTAYRSARYADGIPIEA